MRSSLLAGLSLSFLSLLLTAHAAAGAVWRDLYTKPGSGRPALDREHAYFRPFAVDLLRFRTQLDSSPLQFTTTEGATTTLPMPDGSVQRFLVEESPIMASELAAKFPEIRTYIAFGVDDPSATARLDISPRGFHAVIYGAQGTVYVDPDQEKGVYRSYYKTDYSFAKKRLSGHESHRCLLQKQQGNPHLLTASRLNTQEKTGELVRIYRLAVAATGEYTQSFGGTKAAAMAAIVTAINRVNQILGRDLAIGLVLVADNDAIIYTDAETDPYDNDNPLQILEQNQTNLNKVLGESNYDIGHVFGTGSGGIAIVGAACTVNKAQGTSGISTPENDPFYIDFVAHEIGHQLDANHSFNGTSNFCSSARNGATAVEPGSGSTIMAYAGLCADENIQNASDATFHAVSIGEINAFVAAAGNCYTTQASGNAGPSAMTVNGMDIPTNTPFLLNGSGTDPDSDILSYQWDEMDAGSNSFDTDSTSYGTDNGGNPLFRSFLPKDTALRTLPRLSNLLAGVVDKAEKLPDTDRALNFHLTVRDGKYGVDHVDLQVVAHSSGSGFRIISVNPDQAAYAGSASITLNWDVSGTAGAPINCSNVDIDLLNFDATKDNYCVYSLADDTPNDGSQMVEMSAMSNGVSRFRVMCSDNSFFNISSHDFSVVAASAAPNNCISTDGVSREHGSVFITSSSQQPPTSGGGGGGAVSLDLISVIGLAGLFRRRQRFPRSSLNW